MTDQIEDSARVYSLTPNYFATTNQMRYKAFTDGAKSPEAKEYWQQEMFSKTEIAQLFLDLIKYKYIKCISLFNIEDWFADFEYFKK